MNINIRKVLTKLESVLFPVNKLTLERLQLAYSLVMKLRSHLITLICEMNCDELLAKSAQGVIDDGTVILTINEPLPSSKELTGSMQDYWIGLIQAAIGKAAERQKLPYFDKAFVLIEITTPKHSDNTRLWDTSNRSINLVINNLKGAFFKDDNLEHMAFGVVGNWGEEGKTVIKIMPFKKFAEAVVN